MSFLQSQSEQRELLVNMEKAHQRKQKELLKWEADYEMTKWILTPDQHTTRAVQIIQWYQSIVGEIMEENMGDA